MPENIVPSYLTSHSITLHPRRRKSSTYVTISSCRQWRKLLNKAVDIVPAVGLYIQYAAILRNCKNQSSPNIFLPSLSREIQIKRYKYVNNTPFNKFMCPEVSRGPGPVVITSSHDNGVSIRNSAGATSTVTNCKCFVTWT